MSFEREPPRERPESPPASYGVPRRGGSYVEWSHVVDRLDRATAYWLATVTPEGRPHVVPIWGVIVGHDLYLETGAPETIKNRNLATNDEIVVHLDDPDDVVIVRGRAAAVAPAAGARGRPSRRPSTRSTRATSPRRTAWASGGLVRVDPRTVARLGRHAERRRAGGRTRDNRPATT